MAVRDSVALSHTLLRLFFLVVSLILLVGAALFFAPNLVAHRWLWPLAPFNARFLGAIYLAELVVVIMLLAHQKALPRVAIAAGLPFVAIVSIVSLLYLDQFDPQRRATWAWFILYIGSGVVLLYFLWRYRRWSQPDLVRLSPGWRLFLRLEAVVLALYGLGLLLAPAIFSGFWPWPIDSFHARVYSAVFLSIAVVAFMLAQAAAPAELLTLGLAQSVFNLFAILGLVIVDAAIQRVDWLAPGTWLWLGALGMLFLAGIAIVWQSRQVAPAR